PGTTGSPGTRWAAGRADARNPAWPGHGLPALLRSEEGRCAAGQPARTGRRGPHCARPRPDDPLERLLPAPALLPLKWISQRVPLTPADSCMYNDLWGSGAARSAAVVFAMILAYAIKRGHHEAG